MQETYTMGVYILPSTLSVRFYPHFLRKCTGDDCFQHRRRVFHHRRRGLYSPKDTNAFTICFHNRRRMSSPIAHLFFVQIRSGYAYARGRLVRAYLKF